MTIECAQVVFFLGQHLYCRARRRPLRLHNKLELIIKGIQNKALKRSESILKRF